MAFLYAIPLVYFYGFAIQKEGESSGAKVTASLMQALFIAVLTSTILLIFDKLVLEFIPKLSDSLILFLPLVFALMLDIFNRRFFFSRKNRLAKVAERIGVDIYTVSWVPSLLLYFGAVAGLIVTLNILVRVQ